MNGTAGFDEVHREQDLADDREQLLYVNGERVACFTGPYARDFGLWTAEMILSRNIDPRSIESTRIET